MPSRAAPRSSSSRCAAASRASWDSRSTRRRRCWSAWAHSGTGAARRECKPYERGNPRMSMNEEILVNVTPQETRVAVLAAGQVQELVVEREASRGLVGNIYVGRVARVLPGMQSAFVEIGLERSAFLHVADLAENRKPDGVPSRPIEKMLAEGQPVTVQVLKDPIGAKGARL